MPDGQNSDLRSTCAADGGHIWACATCGTFASDLPDPPQDPPSEPDACPHCSGTRRDTITASNGGVGEVVPCWACAATVASPPRRTGNYEKASRLVESYSLGVETDLQSVMDRVVSWLSPTPPSEPDAEIDWRRRAETAERRHEAMKRIAGSYLKELQVLRGELQVLRGKTAPPPSEPGEAEGQSFGAEGVLRPDRVWVGFAPVDRGGLPVEVYTTEEAASSSGLTTVAVSLCAVGPFASPSPASEPEGERVPLGRMLSADGTRVTQDWRRLPDSRVQSWQMGSNTEVAWAVLPAPPSTSEDGETPAERLERWESAGYGQTGGSSGDRVFVLRRFVREGIGCADCPTPSSCACGGKVCPNG